MFSLILFFLNLEVSSDNVFVGPVLLRMHYILVFCYYFPIMSFCLFKYLFLKNVGDGKSEVLTVVLLKLDIWWGVMLSLVE
jgi:hypothetical protein